eukprot:876459-Pelagomonas_calceolata.AAC.2
MRRAEQKAEREKEKEKELQKPLIQSTPEQTSTCLQDVPPHVTLNIGPKDRAIARFRERGFGMLFGEQAVAQCCRAPPFLCVTTPRQQLLYGGKEAEEHAQVCAPQHEGALRVLPVLMCLPLLASLRGPNVWSDARGKGSQSASADRTFMHLVTACKACLVPMQHACSPATISAENHRCTCIPLMLTTVSAHAYHETYLIMSPVWAADEPHAVLVENYFFSLSVSDPLEPGNPLVFVSPGFEQQSGYPSSEVLGNNCKILQRISAGVYSLQHGQTCICLVRVCDVAAKERRVLLQRESTCSLKGKVYAASKH